MVSNGALFVFEGADVTRKSSVSCTFCELLRGLDPATSFPSFPANHSENGGGLAFRIHHRRASGGLTGSNESSPEAFHVEVLDDGNNVVIDRYWWLNRVDGVARGASAPAIGNLPEAGVSALGRRLPARLFCDDRDEPLRSASMEKWKSWKAAFGNLIARGDGTYPILRIPNPSIP